MTFPATESGYNMYDILSCMQKAIRRGNYNLAAFSAKELRKTFRGVMWRRLLVISAEDCFGVLTKEIVKLCTEDTVNPSNKNIERAVALLCKSCKSRDACYFSCNFILDNRNPRKIEVFDDDVKRFVRSVCMTNSMAFVSMSGGQQFDMFGFSSMEKGYEISDVEVEFAKTAVRLQVALAHRDMDEIGYNMSSLIKGGYRTLLWESFLNYVDWNCTKLKAEIEALRDADAYVNANKKVCDEIFLAKAAMIICYEDDPGIDTSLSSEVVEFESNVDWSKHKILPLESCNYDGELPDYVYDCHTLKGKRMGKTDWDMTVAEQAALFRLKRAYFDDASWIYTYEQDFSNGAIDSKGMEPIREYAKTHPANPVEFIPY